MLAGTAFVFGIVYWMNATEMPPKLNESAEAVAFEVEKKPPPKKERIKRERPKPRKQSPSAPRAPLPNLAASLSGASFSLPSFASTGLGNVSQALLGDTSKKMAMTEGSMDTPPKALRQVQPEFPERARRKGVQGYVKVSVYVNESGSVDQVRILDAAPSGVFEQAAESAIRAWEFQPGVYQGESVAGWVTQTFRFKLQKTT
jgi:protein TonB